VEVDTQRLGKRVDARLSPDGPAGQHAWELPRERTRRKAARYNVKTVELFAGTVCCEEMQARVAYHACEDEAPRAVRLLGPVVPVERQCTRHGVKHPPGESGAGDRAGDDARRERCGMHQTASRQTVVCLEEPRDEPGSEDEANPKCPAGVANAKGRRGPRHENPCPCGCVFVERRMVACGADDTLCPACGGTPCAEVASDCADGSTASKSNGRQWGAVRPRGCELAQDGGGRPVAAGDDDRLRAARRYCPRDALQLREIACRVDTRAPPECRLAEGRVHDAPLSHPPGAQVDDDVDARPADHSCRLASAPRAFQAMLVMMLATMVLGCATSPAMRAAQHGDWRALGQAIAAREARGDLSNAEAASLARVVADRDLRAASPQDAAERIRDARPCAHELDDALASRMKTHDAVGGLAALARLDGRGLDAGNVRALATDEEPHWRAAGTRGLVRSGDAPTRLHALVDPDPLVRREAARAAYDAADVSDATALAEAARVDPEPMVRTEAVRALASLPDSRGNVADLLRDLWTGADDGLREDIARAWAGPSVWPAGGREALRVVVASEHGPGAVEAASAVLRRRDGADEETTHAALGRLVAAIEGGPHAIRLQAVAEAPLDRSEVRAALEKVAAGEDPDVKVGALGRLAGEFRDAGLIARLEALAAPGSAVAPLARLVLAEAGDRRVQAWLEEDLRSERPDVKVAAATALAELGVAARAAPLLADSDPGVRLRSACVLLAAARRR
jgi:hypothetical protein